MSVMQRSHKRPDPAVSAVRGDATEYGGGARTPEKFRGEPVAAEKIFYFGARTISI